MPKSTGRVRPSFNIILRDQVAVYDTVEALAANVPEITLVPLQVEPNEFAQVDAINFLYAVNDPTDNVRADAWIVKGDSGAAIGDTGLRIDELHSRALYFDSKFYNVVTSGITVEQSKWVDFDPAMGYIGDEGGSALHVWLQSTGTLNLTTSLFLRFTRVFRQRIYPNDDAFMEYSTNEIYGNVCG